MAKFKALGNKVRLKLKPDYRTLEVFTAPENVTLVEFETKEVTSLCPITGQPDFAHVAISYQPDGLCLESKSLKLYLQSYRQEACFMEELSSKIYTDILMVLKPMKLRVAVKCTPRGGLTLASIAGDL